jgi:hypothetical protein
MTFQTSDKTRCVCNSLYFFHAPIIDWFVSKLGKAIKILI